MQLPPQPLFNPVRYILSGDATPETLRSYRVYSVHAVSHEQLPQGGNHWCIYLQVGPAATVKIDITPSYYIPSTQIQGGSKANMIISPLNYLYSTRTTHVSILAAREDTTVGGIVDLLISNGRHRYEFDEQGRGCRIWTDDQLSLLQRENIVGDTTAARAAILIKYPDGGEYPLVKGAYY